MAENSLFSVEQTNAAVPLETVVDGDLFGMSVPTTADASKRTENPRQDTDFGKASRGSQAPQLKPFYESFLRQTQQLPMTISGTILRSEKKGIAHIPFFLRLLSSLSSLPLISSLSLSIFQEDCRE